MIAARLEGIRVRGEAVASIEATLIERVDDCRWRALARPAKKLKVGERIRFGETRESMACLLAALDAEVEAKGEAGEVLLRFDVHRRGARRGDRAARRAAAAALYRRAPRAVRERPRRLSDDVRGAARRRRRADRRACTSRPALVDRLEARGVALHRVTLHVGAGTFLPVKADDTSDHKMHAEWGSIDAETAAALNAARERGGRIVASARPRRASLESAADEDGRLHAFSGETSIFITPGYRFRAVDVLLTNFHLPRSTLFMLVCAFSGLETMRAAYAHAIANGYRFYSYGDACLLLARAGGRGG